MAVWATISTVGSSRTCNTTNTDKWHPDKLQTLTDLDSLDALLSSVRSQHVLLKKQVHFLLSM
jgi:hypothetical protein